MQFRFDWRYLKLFVNLSWLSSILTELSSRQSFSRKCLTLSSLKHLQAVIKHCLLLNKHFSLFLSKILWTQRIRPLILNSIFSSFWLNVTSEWLNNKVFAKKSSSRLLFRLASSSASHHSSLRSRIDVLSSSKTSFRANSSNRISRLEV